MPNPELNPNPELILVDDTVTISVQITNVGTISETFFLHAIFSILDVPAETFADIIDGEAFDGFDAIEATVDQAVTVGGRSGLHGIVELAGGETQEVQFQSPPLDVVGQYDIGVLAGVFDLDAGTIVDEQAEIVAPNAFEIYIAAEAELEALAVLA